MKEPKLRDSKKLLTQELYPINEFPEEIIRIIGKELIYMKCVGIKDLSGDGWGDIFAKAIGATHLRSKLGLRDVILDQMAWSLKTIKVKNPHTTEAVISLISGRNSTYNSYSIENPTKNPQDTGDKVLKIWNQRIRIAYANFTSVRTAVLIRSEDMLEFSLLELDTPTFVPSAYRWEVNKNGNLEGFDIENDFKKFTWQPGGAQFTIHYHIPKNAFKFKIIDPPKLDVGETLSKIKYSDEWVEIL